MTSTTIDIPAAVALRAIRAVSLFMDRGQQHEALNQVHVEWSNDVVEFVATDSYRMGIVAVDCAVASPSAVDIPGSVVDRTLKLWSVSAAAKLDGMVRIKSELSEPTDRRVVSLRCDGVTLSARADDVPRFINWRDVSSQSYEPRSGQVAFNPEFLATLRPFGDLVAGKSEPVAVTSYGTTRPAHFEFPEPEHVKHARMVLMPVRLGVGRPARQRGDDGRRL
jgi:DNA polymerase III sliding clamp (beta) subunit (PCNA family)